MASAATLGYQSLPQTSAFAVPSTHQPSSGEAQYWSSNTSTGSADSGVVSSSDTSRDTGAGTSATSNSQVQCVTD